MIAYGSRMSKNLLSKGAEIFRHLRPTYLNKERGTILPSTRGGISFAFAPCDIQGTYDYWVYICPEDVEFSSRAAVKKLRLALENKVEPWGRIVLKEQPLLDTAIASVIKEEHDLPSRASHQAFKIMIQNLSVERLHTLYVQSIGNSKEQYEG